MNNTALKQINTESAQTRTEAFLNGQTELVPPTIKRVNRQSDPLLRLHAMGCPEGKAPPWLMQAAGMPSIFETWPIAYCVRQIAKKRGYA